MHFLTDLLIMKLNEELDCRVLGFSLVVTSKHGCKQCLLIPGSRLSLCLASCEDNSGNTLSESHILPPSLSLLCIPALQPAPHCHQRLTQSMRIVSVYRVSARWKECRELDFRKLCCPSEGACDKCSDWRWRDASLSMPVFLTPGLTLIQVQLLHMRTPGVHFSFNCNGFRLFT